MDYLKFQFSCDTELNEVMIALISDLPFDTFQENETGFDAFMPSGQFTGEVTAHLNSLHERFVFTWQQEIIPYQNWNEIWETNFHPVIVDDFCGIRADFHEPLQHVEYELVINPKMAFGTGHHETTFMVVQLMKGLPLKGASVLDYGCGTGVLAILASKLGADAVDAVDIEMESYANTKINAQENQVRNLRAFCGKLEDVPGHTYDVILANINRNVILDSLATLSDMTKTGAWLVVSGFISDDEALMKDSLSRAGFEFIDLVRKNNWLAIKSRRM